MILLTPDKINGQVIAVTEKININDMVEINTIIKRAYLPNKEGFKFTAFLQDGTSIENVVVKNENGLHTCNRFSEIVGWLPIKEDKKDSEAESIFKNYPAASIIFQKPTL